MTSADGSGTRRARPLGRVTSSPIIRGSAVLGGGRLIAAGIAALWLIVAARRLSVHAFGDLAVLLAVGSVMAIMSDLGYPFLLSHQVAKAGRISRSTLGFVIRQRLKVGVLAAVVGCAAYLVVASDRQPAVVALFAVSLLSTIVYSSLSAALRGLHVFRFEAANEVASRGFVLVVGWLLLTHGGGLVAAVGVYAVADFGSMIVLGFIAGRHVSHGNDGIDHHALRLKNNGHLTAGRFLATLYTRADTWLMALLRGANDAALYGAPYRLLDGFLLVPRSIGAVAVPHLARSEEHPSVGPFVVASAGLAAVFAIPVAIFSKPLLLALFGARYAGSASTLALLALSAIPGAVIMALLPIVGIRRPRPVSGVLASILVLNVGLNLAAIPTFGPVGAAGVNLITQLVLATALLVGLRSERRQVIESIRSSATRAHSAVSGSTTI